MVELPNEIDGIPVGRKSGITRMMCQFLNDMPAYEPDYDDEGFVTNAVFDGGVNSHQTTLKPQFLVQEYDDDVLISMQYVFLD